MNTEISHFDAYMSEFIAHLHMLVPFRVRVCAEKRTARLRAYPVSDVVRRWNYMRYQT